MNRRRFVLFDNGGSSADRYTLVDLRRYTSSILIYGFPDYYYFYMHFDESPGHPQGIAMTNEVNASDHNRIRSMRPNPLGSLVTGSELPPQAWRWLEKDLRRPYPEGWDATDEDIDRLYRGA